MKLRRVLPVLALGMVLPSLPSATAAGAAYYERILFTGDADDYANGNQALDLDALFVSETFKFDPQAETGQEVVTLRLTPKKFDDLVFCTTPGGGPVPPMQACRIRYDIYFESGGQARHVNATFAYVYGQEYTGPSVTSTNATVRHNATSIYFVLPRAAYGLVSGSAITKLWATSSLESQDAPPSVQDRMPGDNEGTPSGLHPEFEGLFAPDQILLGTYEFFRVTPTTPLVQRSAYGNPVEFHFEVTPTSGVSGDELRVLWDVPEEWSVTPSRGESAGRPLGVLSNLNGGETIEFFFRASATDAVDVGQTFPIIMHVVSYSGGSLHVPTTVLVTGSRYESADHVFTLLPDGALRTGRTETLRFTLADASGGALTDLPVRLDFAHNERTVAKVPAAFRDGAWEVQYAFPEAGPWTLDAYVEELDPAPHQVFHVNVEKARKAPGFEPLLLVLAVLGIGILHAGRRRP